jgi:hypothetical protein
VVVTKPIGKQQQETAGTAPSSKKQVEQTRKELTIFSTLDKQQEQ